MKSNVSLNPAVPAMVPKKPQLLTRALHWLGNFGWSGLTGLLILMFWLAAAVFGSALLNRADVAGSVQIFGPISSTHWLGTDYLGRDMLIRVIDGASYTVGVAIVATMLASGIGTMLALFAAASGRWIDATLSRALDTVTSIPSKMFALIMVAGFGSSVTMLIATATIIYVPGAYRMAIERAIR